MSLSPPEAYAQARTLIDEVHSKDPASVSSLSSLSRFVELELTSLLPSLLLLCVRLRQLELGYADAMEAW